jgi:hypothetical protein
MKGPIEPRSRVNFFTGRIVSADDLRDEQEQSRARQWLHNRLLHGNGVVSGLDVAVEGNEVQVSAGVAIDGLGREIILAERLGVDAGGVVPENHGRIQLVLAWAEEPADEVVGPDGPVPGRFVVLARVFRRGNQLVVDPSVRRLVHQHVHRDA